MTAPTGGPPPEKKLLSRQQVADRLDVPLGTVERVTETGEMPARKLGRRVVVAAGDADAWLERAGTPYAPKATKAAS